MVRYYNDSTNYRLRKKRRVAAWLRSVAEEEGYALADVVDIHLSVDGRRAEDICNIAQRVALLLGNRAQPRGHAALLSQAIVCGVVVISNHF